MWPCFLSNSKAVVDIYVSLLVSEMPSKRNKLYSVYIFLSELYLVFLFLDYTQMAGRRKIFKNGQIGKKIPNLIFQPLFNNIFHILYFYSEPLFF